MILSNASEDQRVIAGASLQHDQRVEKAHAAGKLDGIYDGLGRDAIRSGRQTPHPTSQSAYGRMLVAKRLNPLDLTIAHTSQNSDPTVVNLPPSTTEHTLTLAEYLHHNYMQKSTQAASACRNDTLQGKVDESLVTEIQTLLDTENVTIGQVMMN